MCADLHVANGCNDGQFRLIVRIGSALNDY